MDNSPKSNILFRPNTDPYHINFIKLLIDNKRLLSISIVTTAVLTSIVMLLQPNYYRSSALFYPVNESAFQGLNIAETREIDYYGNDHDIDRIMSIGHSPEFIHGFISKENLAPYYEIDASSNKGKEKLVKRFKKLFILQKTSQDAIELGIEDKDPEKAAQLAGACYDMLKSRVNDLSKNSLASIFSNTQQNVKETQSKLINITENLAKARKEYGIYDTKSQGEVLAKLEINQPGQKTREIIDKYNAGIAAVTQLEIEQEEYARTISALNAKAIRLKQAIEAEVPVFHLIQEPAIPFMKSRPRRSLYILCAAGIAGFLTLCYLLIQQSLKE